MSRKLLLRVAAFLVLFTCVGHTIGSLKSRGDASPEVGQTYELMQKTLVPFPFGEPKDLVTILLGANLCVSVYLLVSGVLMIMLSNGALLPAVLGLNSVGLLLCAGISYFCFFPLPTVCIGIGGLLGLVALRRP